MTLNVDIHLVDSIDEVWALKQWMGERHPYLAVDTETEGLQWWRHRPRLLQVGNADIAWVIPWHLWGGAIMEVIGQYDGLLLMHNAKFDVSMFEHWSGVRLPRHRIHDTRVLGHILDPTRSTALKDLGERHVDRMAAASQRMMTEGMALHGWTWATVPIDWQPYWIYAGMDVILTTRLFEKFHPLVMQDAPFAYEMEMATQWCLLDMEMRGVAVDLEMTSAKQRVFREYVDRMEAWCVAEFGVKPGQDIEVIKRLQRDGIEFTKLTPKKTRYALDKEVLEAVVETGHPLAKAVFDRRRIQRLCSAYLDNFVDLEYNGRVHPNYNPAKKKGGEDAGEGYGARTGRMSVADPSLQNLPRKNNSYPAADAIRNCITATPGGQLLMCDFDQVEFRIMAHLSQDPGLMRAFGEGDFFVNLAREIWSDPTIEKKDPRRQPTKNAGYAKIYGAGIPKFAKTAGITVEVADTIMHRLDTLYPGIEKWTYGLEATARIVEQDEGVAYARSPLTNRRHICEVDKYYRLVNYVIQGTAAEVLKMKDLELQRAGVGELLVLNVHDEVILDVPTEDLEEVSRTVMDVMNDDQMFSVPLTASLDIAERWGGKG